MVDDIGPKIQVSQSSIGIVVVENNSLSIQENWSDYYTQYNCYKYSPASSHMYSYSLSHWTISEMSHQLINQRLFHKCIFVKNQ